MNKKKKRVLKVLVFVFVSLQVWNNMRNCIFLQQNLYFLNDLSFLIPLKAVFNFLSPNPVYFSVFLLLQFMLAKSFFFFIKVFSCEEMEKVVSDADWRWTWIIHRSGHVPALLCVIMKGTLWDPSICRSVIHITPGRQITCTQRQAFDCFYSFIFSALY